MILSTQEHATLQSWRERSPPSHTPSWRPPARLPRIPVENHWRRPVVLFLKLSYLFGCVGLGCGMWGLRCVRWDVSFWRLCSVLAELGLRCPRTYGIVAPQPGIEPVSLALQGGLFLLRFICFYFRLCCIFVAAHSFPRGGKGGTSLVAEHRLSACGLQESGPVGSTVQASWLCSLWHVGSAWTQD